MQAAIRSIPSKARRSWKNRIGLPAMVLLTAVAAVLFGLLNLGTHPAPVASHAANSDIVRLQQAVKDQDEAAAAASWAQLQAMERAKASANRTAATTVIAGIECGADCLTLIWPDGTESTTSLSIAFDYAAFCGCTIVMQLPSQSASAATDASAQHALKEQQIATWTELYVTLPAMQGH